MRAASSEMIEALRSSLATFCGLLRIGPLPDGSYLGFTSNGVDMEYDASLFDPAQPAGELTYFTASGFLDSDHAATADLGVDNSEAQVLEPMFPNQVGITPEMVERGELDAVEFDVFVVNFMDTSMGHIHWASGVLGEQVLTKDGIVRLELRSWSQLMKQRSVVQLTSVTCRAPFGSVYPGTSPGPEVPEAEFPCNYDITGEWVEFEVASVGTETVREFTITAAGVAPLAPTDHYYAPGLAVFEDGDNAGQSREIEAYTSGGAVTLLMTTRNPVQVGDLGRIRRGCTKRWEGHNSCETYANRPWFRGEPNLMIGDGLALSIPGVASGDHVGGGTGEVSAS